MRTLPQRAGAVGERRPGLECKTPQPKWIFNFIDNYTIVYV